MNVAEEGTTSGGSVVWSKDTEKFIEHFPGHHIFVDKPEFDGTPDHYHNGYKGVIGAEITLRGRNGEGHGVFFTVNELDEDLDPGRNRTGKMWVKSRAAFMDDDHPRRDPRSDFKLEPSLVVKTSGSEDAWKFHYYWLTDCQDLEGWQGVQRSIIEKYDGDRNAKDLSRYLRLPGYNHNKGEPVEVVWKGSGTVYEWNEIEDAFGKLAKSSAGSASDGVDDNGSAKSFTRAELIKQVKDGEHFHDPILKLSYMNKQDDDPDWKNIENCRTILETTPVELRVNDWQRAWDETPDMVKGAKKKDENKPFEFSTYEKADRSLMPWPPGRMGEIAEAVHKISNYPSRTIAVITSLAMTAGIAGRRFNVNGTGLNLYINLLMNTGGGKEAIGEFLRYVLKNLIKGGGSLSSNGFIGPGTYTAAKGLAHRLEKGYCFLSVFTEAGLMLQSASGDPKSLARALLAYYGNSGAMQSADGQSYSDPKDSIGDLYAPCLTGIGESTPHEMMEVFRKTAGHATQDGMIPRNSSYLAEDASLKTNRHKVYPNRGDDWVQKVMKLANFCSKTQSLTVPMPILFHASDRMFDYADEMKAKSKECAGIDNIKSDILSRCGLKAWKIACLATIINNVLDDPRSLEDILSSGEMLEIGDAEWDWAKDMIQFELDGLSDYFRDSEADSGFYDVLRNCVLKNIKRIFDGEYKDRQLQLSSGDIAKKRMRDITFRRLIRNIKQVKKLKAPYGKDGYDALVNYMEEKGYAKVDKDGEYIYLLPRLSALDSD